MKIVFLKLSIVLLLCNCTYFNEKKANQPEEVNLHQYKIFNESCKVIQPPLSIEYQSKLLSNVRENVTRFRDYVGKNGFPNFYGGDFISGNYTLTFYIVGDSVDSHIRLSKILGNSDFKIKSCKYSYNELNMAQEIITAFIYNKDNRSVVKNLKIYSSVINIEENCVYVMLEECTDSIIDLIKTDIADFKCLKFKQINNFEEVFVE